jgi:hypothetical protein
MKMWENKFDGRCFCVGNGPSLNRTPLHLLENEYTFGLNRVAEIYPFTSWRPTFYVNVTVATSDEGWSESAKEAMVDTPSFVSYGALPHVLEAEGKVLFIPHHVFPMWVADDLPRQEDPDPNIWSHDVSRTVSKYGGSMLAVMQVAVYLGFKELIMVGCDLGWKPFDYEEDKDPNHFTEDYWGKMNLSGAEIVVTPELAQRYTDDARSCHVLAKKVCDKLGVKIYNATIGGELEVYPRVDLLEVI